MRFKNFDGQEESLFKILHDNGVNWVRLRLFNDPYEDGIKQFGAQHLLLLRDLTHGGVPDKRLLRDGHGPFVAGRPLVDDYVVDIPQDTWIEQPWDMGVVFVPPISGR